jgi:hypothetical protein
LLFAADGVPEPVSTFAMALVDYPSLGTARLAKKEQ